MVPVSLQIPAGVVLIGAGLLACLAGYRLFRAVLTIYGFLLGALFASSLVAPSNVPLMLLALAVGGAIGAAVLYAGYFAGVMLVGGVLGALVLHAAWVQLRGAEPHILIVVLFAAVGAAVATKAQRYVVILATAIAGAQTTVAGVQALLAHGGARRPGTADVWIGHLGPGPAGLNWPFVAWIVLSLVGALVQFRSGSRRSRRK